MTKQPWNTFANSRLLNEGRFSESNWLSPAFPCYRNGRLSAAIIPFPRTAPQKDPGYIFAPRFVAYLPYPDATPVEIVQFKPEDFGLTIEDMKDPFCSFERPAIFKPGEFLDLTIQLNEALSRGFELGYFQPHSVVTDQEKADAKIISEVITRMTPIGLIKLYQNAGKILYAWIKQCS